ncbi:MAG TPA: hypothetical protein VLI06_11195 [Solimonas sp.]|nr:hypothetical protein [Solimonas sp.]
MFASVSAATLKILFFRAGPDDFPFDSRPNLLLACIGFALLSNAAILSLMLPPGVALMAGATNTAMLALFTRLSLALRKLDNRFQQTFNALLTTSSVLTLLMLPFFAQVAPVWMELGELLRKNPELANHPEQWPAMPKLAVNLLAMLGIWQLAVICRIFLLAAGAVVMLALIGMMFLMVALQLGATGA